MFIIDTSIKFCFLIKVFSFTGYQDIIATGGFDTNAVIFDRSSGQILSTLSGHSKKVFIIILHWSLAKPFLLELTELLQFFW